MAENAVDSTFAAAWRISGTLRQQNKTSALPLRNTPYYHKIQREMSDLWSPASLFGHPADLRLTHQTADPVAAVLLLDDHLTFGTVHGLAGSHELLRSNVNIRVNDQNITSIFKQLKNVLRKTSSISVVCRAASSFCALTRRSSWYSLQFIFLWMAYKMPHALCQFL